MRHTVPSRPFSFAPRAALALSLAAAGCAQVEGAFQQAESGFSSLFSSDSATTEASTEAGVEAAARTDSTAGTSTADMSAEEAQYQAALAARARGADGEAFKAFRGAASKGHPAAAYETSQAYFEGRGVKAEPAKAMVWLERAATLGESRAQYALGLALLEGNGVQQNETKAVALLSNAAAQGHMEAQYTLGEAYSSGRGVPKNAPWAARWYGKAANQGMREAMYAYGLVHARGIGLPLDRTEGYRWLLLAARAGHERAEVVRRALEAKMAPEAIKLSEAWAERFQPVREQSFADAPTVKYVQQVLNTMGYEAGPVDGQPGQKTRVAVDDYQKSAGLQRDGRISPGLVDRLLAEQAKAP
jgi:TPR repeat protein